MNPGALLDTLKRRTGFTEAHAEVLVGLGGYMVPLASEVALAFYDYLGRDAEMREILWGVPGRVERLYGSFAAWYRELFSGVYDADYAHRRYRIGLIHARVGVTPSHMVPAMGIVQELSLEHMRTALRSAEVFPAVEAFEKIIAIEIALIEESYLAALEAGFKLGMATSSREALSRGAGMLLQEAQA